MERKRKGGEAAQGGHCSSAPFYSCTHTCWDTCSKIQYALCVVICCFCWRDYDKTVLVFLSLFCRWRLQCLNYTICKASVFKWAWMTSGGVSFNMNEHLQLIFSFTFMEVLLRFNKLKTLPLLFRLKFTAYQESMIFFFLKSVLMAFRDHMRCMIERHCKLLS